MLSNIDFGSYFHTKKYEKGLSTGGDKIADWGGSKGGWGGHVPPSLYVKRGPVFTSSLTSASQNKDIQKCIFLLKVRKGFFQSAMFLASALKRGSHPPENILKI